MYSDKAHSRSKYECQDFSVPSTIISLYEYTSQRSLTWQKHRLMWCFTNLALCL